MFKSFYLRHLSKKTEKYGNFYINKDNNSEYENHWASSKKIELSLFKSRTGTSFKKSQPNRSIFYLYLYMLYEKKLLWWSIWSIKFCGLIKKA